MACFQVAFAIVFFLLSVIFVNLADVKDIASGHKEAEGAMESLCIFSIIVSFIFAVLGVIEIVGWVQRLFS